MREEQPVHWHPRLKCWILSRYEDVKTAHVTRQLSPDSITPFYNSLPEKKQSDLAEVIRYLSLWMVFRDPPEHTRIRKLMNLAFTPTAIQNLEPSIQEIVNKLMDGFDPGETIDIVSRLSTPLPALVIMKILGIPEEMLPEVKKWSDDMMGLIGSAQDTSDKYGRAKSGSHQMADYFYKLIENRRKTPGDDILSTMIMAHDDGDTLTGDELIATCMLILFAGHETTTNLISGSVRMLDQFSDQKKLLIQNPDLAETAIEEFLRYDGPVNSVARIVIADHDIGGITLKAGDRIFALNSSANRDPDQFDRPDILDITRQKNRHLTFGFGVHFCLGAALARLEGRVAINSFLERFPDYKCTKKESLRWIDSMIMRGVHNLPVTLKQV